MKALTFEIHLLEPLLATQIGGGDPNSAVGLDFIPGSLIRGLVITRYVSEKTVDAADPEFRRLFLEGSVRYLNAYPQAYGKRSLPVPLSWHVPKYEEKPVLDFAFGGQADDQQWRRVTYTFCHLWQEKKEFEGIPVGFRAKAEWIYPQKHINIHNAREDRQRVVKEQSTVFRYEALAPEQVFDGVILAEKDDDLETIKTYLEESEFGTIGRSHTAGYGKVRIQNIAIQEDWREYLPVGEIQEGIIIVTLLSDTLVRDPRAGEYVSSLEPIVGVKPVYAFTATRIVGGFNRKWNLPLPQGRAIRAGSVFVFPASEELRARLQTLEERGIGERRAEGFGRIAVNWHCMKEVQIQQPVEPSPSHPNSVRDLLSRKLAKRMLERMLRDRLDQALISAINRFEIRKHPSNAQLSRLRVIVQRALAQKDLTPINEHLENLKQSAKKQFLQARIGGDNLLEWLRELCQSSSQIWGLLGVDERKLPQIGDIKAELTNSLAIEYIVRLIEAVFHKAQKTEEATNV